MFKTIAVVFVFFIICNVVNSVSYITPCEWSDRECLKTSSQAALPVVASGIPELGVPVADPMFIDRMESNTGGLDLTLTDVTITGISQCKLEKVKRNVDKSSISITALCPLLLKSQYTVSGVLVFTPIEGHGNFGITAEKLKISMNFKMTTETGGDGEAHWKIVGHDYNYDPLKKVHIKVENLFNGDKNKAEPVLQLIDVSWREFILDIGRPFVDQVITRVVDSVNRLFTAVPAADLEIPEIHNR